MDNIPMNSSPPEPLNTTHLNQILQQMQKNQEETNNALKKTTDALDTIKAELNEMHSSVASNTAKINRLEHDQGETRDALKGELEELRRKVAIMAQKANDVSLIVKGFPLDTYDADTVITNLIKHFNLDGGANDYYKFSRNIGVDRETNQEKVVHMLSVNLNHTNDRVKIFQQLKANGTITYKDLIPDCDNNLATTTIHIENKLSVENLKIKKRLLELKRMQAIEKFFMRSGLFIIKLQGANETQAIYSPEQLNELFPETTCVSQDNDRPIKRPNKRQIVSPPSIQSNEGSSKRVARNRTGLNEQMQIT